jgi:hypothetical protein
MVENAPEKIPERLAGALTTRLLKVVDEGVGPMTGARVYAESRRALLEDPEAAIKRIIRETLAASATTGFTTGLGGFIVLPVALPANITGQAILNARMVAAIAHLRGWDLTDEVVRNAILITVAGGSPNAVLAQFGITFSRKLTETAIKRIPIALIREINKRVGFMLLAKYGTKRSVLTLAKGVPIVGGVVSGTVDAGFTKAVSTLAKRSFPQVETNAGSSARAGRPGEPLQVGEPRSTD